MRYLDSHATARDATMARKSNNTELAQSRNFGQIRLTVEMTSAKNPIDVTRSPIGRSPQTGRLHIDLSHAKLCANSGPLGNEREAGHYHKRSFYCCYKTVPSIIGGQLILAGFTEQTSLYRSRNWFWTTKLRRHFPMLRSVSLEPFVHCGAVLRHG